MKSLNIDYKTIDAFDVKIGIGDNLEYTPIEIKERTPSTITVSRQHYSRFTLATEVNEEEPPVVPQGMPTTGALGLGLTAGVIGALGAGALARRRKRDLGLQVEFPSEEK